MAHTKKNTNYDINIGFQWNRRIKKVNEGGVDQRATQREECEPYVSMFYQKHNQSSHISGTKDVDRYGWS